MLQYALLALCAIAVWTDVRTGRIPNWLTGPMLVAGIGTSIFTGRILESMLGGLVAAFIWIPAWHFAHFGGGDTKLLIAIGAWTGPAGVIEISLITAVVGGVLAIVKIMTSGKAMEVVRLYASYAKSLAMGIAPDRKNVVSQLTIPYGIAIAAGTLIHLWR